MKTDRKAHLEANRLKRLHGAFLGVREKRLRGEKLMRALKRVAQRRLKSRGKSYSLKSIIRHWYRWTLDARPEALARNYAPPPKARPPAALVTEFVRRLLRDPRCSCAAAHGSLVQDLALGRSLPGLSDRSGSPRTRNGQPVRLPSLNALRRALGPEFALLRGPAVQGRRAVAKLDGYLKARVQELRKKGVR